MTDKFEDQMALIEDMAVDGATCDTEDLLEAVDTAADCMGFVLGLNELFRTNGGVDLPEEPNVAILENAVDAFFGELLAGTIFLAQDEFNGAPKLLRGTSKALEDQFKGALPPVVVQGYKRLAARIERYRETQDAMNLEITEIIEETS